MNWKQRYEAIKVGDMVQCVEELDNAPKNCEGGGGAGWKLGYKFKITDVDNRKSTDNVKLYWCGRSDSGVWEGWVRKVN